jgi:hypothetical protein
MLRETPILPIRIHVEPGKAAIFIGDQDVTAKVRYVGYEIAEGISTPRLTIQFDADDIEIEGMATATRLIDGDGFEDAAAFIEALDMKALKRDAANSLGSGKVNASDRLVEMVVERLRAGPQ